MMRTNKHILPGRRNSLLKSALKRAERAGERTSLGRPLGTTRLSEKECPTSAPSGPRRQNRPPKRQALQRAREPLALRRPRDHIEGRGCVPSWNMDNPHLSFGEAANMVFTTGAKGFRRGE